MADHAIGADHLDGMDGMFGRFGVGRRRAAARLAFAGLGGRGRRVLAGEGGDQVAGGNLGPGVTLPGGTAAELGGGKTLFAGLRKIGLPARVHRIGVGLPGGIHLLDIGGIGAVEEGGRFEDLVRGAIQFVCRGLFSHFKRLWGGLLGLSPSWCRASRRSRVGLGGNAFFGPIQRSMRLIWAQQALFARQNRDNGQAAYACRIARFLGSQ